MTPRSGHERSKNHQSINQSGAKEKENAAEAKEFGTEETVTINRLALFLS